MAATGNEAVTLAQLKTAMENSGSGGSNVHVFQLTASTTSFTFEKSGIEFTRFEKDFTIVAVDSEYGVGLLGVFQHDRSTRPVTVANVTGGAADTRYCYFVTSAGGSSAGNITYEAGTITMTALASAIHPSVSLWIDKA